MVLDLENRAFKQEIRELNGLLNTVLVRDLPCAFIDRWVV